MALQVAAQLLSSQNPISSLCQLSSPTAESNVSICSRHFTQSNPLKRQVTNKTTYCRKKNSRRDSQSIIHSCRLFLSPVRAVLAREDSNFSGTRGKAEGKSIEFDLQSISTTGEKSVEILRLDLQSRAESGLRLSLSQSNSMSAQWSEAQAALQETIRKKEQMGRKDTDLKSTAIHRAWVTAGAIAVGGMLLKSFADVDSVEGAASAVSAILGAYLLADFGTGIYHWGIDNYGDGKTPVFGPQIDAFQGHHQRPWTITKREMANNLESLTRPAFFFLLPFLFTPSNAVLDGFLGSFLCCVVLSQQFHAWAHTPKSKLPGVVVVLQDAGLLVGRRMHGTHHRPPYNTNYCIVSGICNGPLDKSGLIPWMEGEILRRWGVAPRSWGETAPEWIQEDYYEDGSPADTTAM